MSPRDSQDPAVKNYIIGVEMTEKELLAPSSATASRRSSPPRARSSIPTCIRR
jgi:molecular chaperone GrpE